jgi:hypothetical protein
MHHLYHMMQGVKRGSDYLMCNRLEMLPSGNQASISSWLYLQSFICKLSSTTDMALKSSEHVKPNTVKVD